MNLPEASIKNSAFVILMYVLFVTLGIYSYFTMPRSEDPYLEFPFAGVYVIAPGVSVVDIETGIADPLEDRFNGIEGVEHINTTIQDGLLSIFLECEPHTDMQEIKNRLSAEVSDAEAEFPPGIVAKEVWTFDILYVKILQVVIAGDRYNLRDLYKYAEIIKREFQKVYGATDIKIMGYPEEEVAITLVPERLSQYNIPVITVYALLQANNYNIPGGEVIIGDRKFNLRTSGKYESLKQIGNTAIGAYNGRPMYLKDIADVDYDYANPRYKVRYTGKPALIVTAEQQKGKDIITVNAGLKAALTRAKKVLPSDLTIKVAFEQAEYVNRRIGTFFENLEQGIILVGIIILLIVGIRPSVIIMFAVPTSVFLAIAIFDITGMGLHQMTITALIIALGMLVDNAIVITENIQRLIDTGMRRLEAAIKGASEVGWAITSSTVTTVLAFLPLMMMKEEAGDYIRSMPFGVSIVLLCSLLVAMTLSPFLARRILKRTDPKHLGKSTVAFKKIVDRFYKPRLEWALDNRKRVIIAAVFIFITAISLFPLIGVSFFPMSDKTFLLINANLPQGASLEKTGAVMSKIEKLIEKDEAVRDIVTNIGAGNPPVYYAMGGTQNSKNFGQMLVQLKTNLNLDDITTTAERFRRKVSSIAGARIEVKQMMHGHPVEAAVIVRIFGDNPKVLKELSRKIKKIVEETPGCINVNNPYDLDSMDMKLDINRDEAAMLGVQLIDIDRVSRLAVSGLIIGKYQDDEGKMYDIVLRLPKNENDRFSDFGRIYVPSISGRQVPLTEVAKVTFTPAYSVVQHRDLQRFASVYADVFGRQVSDVSRELERKLDGFNFPTGYSFQIGGEEEERGEAFSSMYRATIFAVLAIFGVLVLQFRSFVQTFIIFVSVPFALVGSILALLITGYTFSFSAFVGLTSLIGIVVNNAIILVDYTNKLIVGGMPLKEAVITSGSRRFRPILATTLTTIGGLLPLTIGGGDLWAPLSWVIIGGLLTSTMLTLVLVPVLYYIFTNWDLSRRKARA